MNLTPSLAALALAAATAAAGIAPVQAAGRLADVSVIDRTSGAVLPTYYHRGEYWVAGTPGAKYAILVRNRLGERVLAVTAVDGVNVLTGDTAGWDQAGYVFGPSQGYQISGWRKSNSEVAAFEFTASPNSYAERTGRPANVGVIGVALFREKPAVPYEPPPVRWPEPAARNAPAPSSLPQGELAPKAGAASGGPAREEAAEAPPSQAPQPSGAADAQKSLRAQSSSAFATTAPKLGTGHGQREASHVRQTEFARLQTQPNEVVRIRYDSRENLVALGVIRERAPQPPVPNPFPESPTARFVPDPPAYPVYPAYR